MKSFTRILSLFIAALIALSAAGCSRQEEAPSDQAVTSVSSADAENNASEAGPAGTAAPDSPAAAVYAAHTHVFDGGVCTVCGYRQVPSGFPAGEIAKEDTVIENDKVRLEIEKGLYIPGNTREMLDAVVMALEAVTGLSFLDGPNAGQVTMKVEHSYFAELNSNVNKESEFGQGYAADKEAVMSSGDLFLGKSGTVSHELAHTLSFCYDPDMGISKVFCEGFAAYSEYAVTKYLKENDPVAAYYLDREFMTVNNMTIKSGEWKKIKEHELAYWTENDVPTTCNPGYDLGFRVMDYLSEAYGSYGEWLRYYDGFGDEIKAVEKAYGEGALDGFYDWVDNNSERFDEVREYTYDMTAISAVNIYPMYHAFDNQTVLMQPYGPEMDKFRFRYRDLSVSFEELRKYIGDYKGHPVDKLDLTVKGDVEVIFYDSRDKVIKQVNSPNRESLENVSYVRLDGEGECTCFEVRGYDSY